MPKQGLTEIVCVVDRSGSMGIVKQDAIGSFNSFVEDQKKAPGEAIFSLTLFNTTYELRHNGVPINDVPGFTESTYFPNGATALLDAVGKTIDEVGERLSKAEEKDRPERLVFVILTDGEENSSKEYSRKQVMEKIQHQTDVYKWEFVFLAAGKEAFSEALKIGIKARNISSYAAGDPVAHTLKVRALSRNVKMYRLGEDVKWGSGPEDGSTKKDEV
jgi:uncharacterized protein YegL